MSQRPDLYPVDAENTGLSFDERVAARRLHLRPAELRVALHFGQDRARVLHVSAAALAAAFGTSDATVVRTAKALGYRGMEDLRRSLAAEMQRSLSPGGRLARTLDQAHGNLRAAFELTLDTGIEALQRLRRDLPWHDMTRVVSLLSGAQRVATFGMGPTRAMASYLKEQLNRFGIASTILGRGGLQFADDLLSLRPGDVVVAFAYTRTSRELRALVAEANRLALPVVLITDALELDLDPVRSVKLRVERGRAEMLSLHTATLGFLEALMVCIAVSRPDNTLASLQRLHALRSTSAEPS